MIIALASPRIASTIDEGLDKIKKLLFEASAQGAEIVCFPEAYIPGLRGQDFEVSPFDQSQQERALKSVAQWSRTYGVATILGMERIVSTGTQIAAFVIDGMGQLQGCQTKNQLDPTEDRFYVPGEYPANLRGQWYKVWSSDLPRGLALSRDGEMGGGSGR